MTYLLRTILEVSPLFDKVLMYFNDVLNFFNLIQTIFFNAHFHTH